VCIYYRPALIHILISGRVANMLKNVEEPLMKFILLALLSISSYSAFAQAVNSIDLVLFNEPSDRSAIHVAKVEITRERYDRMLKEDLFLGCKVTTDPDLSLLFFRGQVSAQHKKSRIPVKTCTTRGCQNTKFEDLANDVNVATNAYAPDTIGVK